MLASLLAAPTPSAQGLVPDALAADLDTAADAAAALVDTSDAGLRVELARLGLARTELAAVSSWQSWRPSAHFFASLSSRGLVFPSVSAQGYDPAYAAISRWPGDTWGVTVSWSLDQVLDRRPLRRARAAVEVAEARADAYRARREQQQARAREQALARAERDADRREREADRLRRAALAAAQLRIEAGFLARRLDAQRELLRLAEITYGQGQTDYPTLARARLAVLAAEHACATTAARLDAAEHGDCLAAHLLPTSPALGSATLDFPDPDAP